MITLYGLGIRPRSCLICQSVRWLSPWTPALSRGGLDVLSCMANVLTPRVFEGLEAELCLTPFGLKERLGHREDEHTVAVGSVGQFAIDGLWQDDLTVVRAYRPL
jgi:hypothetical protein